MPSTPASASLKKTAKKSKEDKMKKTRIAKDASGASSAADVDVGYLSDSGSSENESLHSRNYDGADANSEASAEAPIPVVIDLTNEKWNPLFVPELASIVTRYSAAPLAKSIDRVLPAFSGRNPGCRVNKTPDVTIVKTALQYLMLFLMRVSIYYLLSICLLISFALHFLQSS